MGEKMRSNRLPSSPTDKVIAGKSPDDLASVIRGGQRNLSALVRQVREVLPQFSDDACCTALVEANEDVDRAIEILFSRPTKKQLAKQAKRNKPTKDALDEDVAKQVSTPPLQPSLPSTSPSTPASLQRAIPSYPASPQRREVPHHISESDVVSSSSTSALGSSFSTCNSPGFAVSSPPGSSPQGDAERHKLPQGETRPLTAAGKDLLKQQKKLREVQKLEERMAAGIKIDALQLDKVKRKWEILYAVQRLEQKVAKEDHEAQGKERRQEPSHTEVFESESEAQEEERRREPAHTESFEAESEAIELTNLQLPTFESATSSYPDGLFEQSQPPQLPTPAPGLVPMAALAVPFPPTAPPPAAPVRPPASPSRAPPLRPEDAGSHQENAVAAAETRREVRHIDAGAFPCSSLCAANGGLPSALNPVEPADMQRGTSNLPAFFDEWPVDPRAECFLEEEDSNDWEEDEEERPEWADEDIGNTEWKHHDWEQAKEQASLLHNPASLSRQSPISGEIEERFAENPDSERHGDGLFEQHPHFDLQREPTHAQNLHPNGIREQALQRELQRDRPLLHHPHLEGSKELLLNLALQREQALAQQLHPELQSEQAFMQHLSRGDREREQHYSAHMFSPTSRPLPHVPPVHPAHLSTTPVLSTHQPTTRAPPNLTQISQPALPHAHAPSPLSTAHLPTHHVHTAHLSTAHLSANQVGHTHLHYASPYCSTMLGRGGVVLPMATEGAANLQMHMNGVPSGAISLASMEAKDADRWQRALWQDAR